MLSAQLQTADGQSWRPAGENSGAEPDTSKVGGD